MRTDVGRKPSVAVVTGGGRGIGFAIAQRLAGVGHHVLITDIDEGLARDAAATLGPTASWMVQDVRHVESHARVAERANDLGRLVVWTNNAGILIAGDSWSNGPQDIAACFEVNALGVIAGSNAAVEAMPDGGRILNIASMASRGPVPGLSVYAATKAAVLSFSMSLQGDLDHAGRPIRVHALCPDVVATAMVTTRSTDPDAAILFAGTRQFSPDDIADAAMKLLDSGALVRSVPRWGALLVRATDVAPRFGSRMNVMARRAGERRQRGVPGA
jgi:NAD(P)-dependent dehydrogenase (short-subunit alcohol dehydrogenase family)